MTPWLSSASVSPADHACLGVPAVDADGTMWPARRLSAPVSVPQTVRLGAAQGRRESPGSEQHGSPLRPLPRLEPEGEAEGDFDLGPLVWSP